MSDLERVRKRLSRWSARRLEARRALRRELRALEAVERRERDVARALVVAQAVAESVQRRAHGPIAALATRCLRAVLEEPYALEIVTERKRGRAESRFAFTRDGHEVDPTSASGGGAVLVAAFALRLAALLYSSKRQRRALILDEPFHYCDESLVPRLRELLEELSREARVQIVLVTHERDLRAGRVVEIAR